MPGFITALNPPFDPRRSHREHVDALLFKPVSLDEILTVLENLLP